MYMYCTYTYYSLHTLPPGGNSETVLVANVWAEAGHIHESLSTLRFASRMMGVACRPVANVLQDPAQLVRQYQDEVAALKQELAMHDTLAKRCVCVCVCVCVCK